MQLSRFLVCSVIGLACIAPVFAQDTVQPLQWQPLYEPGSGGAITAVAVDPRDSNHIVSLGDMLGVATSFEGGDSWQPTFGFSTYEFSGGISFHPTDPNVIWIGSASGPYLSTDKGIHWQSKRVGMPEPSAGKYTSIIEKIVFDPANPQRLLAFGGTSRNWNECDTFGWIWESLDNGEHWKHIGTLSDDGFSTDDKKGANIHWVQYEPNSKTRLHLRTGSGQWFTSDDNGRTWQKHLYSGVMGGLRSITFHPTNAQIIWATTDSTTRDNTDATREPGGVWKSSDGGKTFVESDKGIAKVNAHSQGTLASNFANVIVSAADPNVLFTNDGAWNAGVIYKSSDGGANWFPVASRQGIGVEQKTGTQQVFQPKTATFAGISVTGVADPQNAARNYWYNTEFILRTRDGGKTWDDATAYQPDAKNHPDNWRGRGWVGWCATNFAWNPFRPTQAIAQCMDAGKAWITDDNGQNWRYAQTPNNPWLGGQDVTFTRDGHIFASTGQFGQNNGIMKSADWGQTWMVLEGEKHGLPASGWGQKPEYAGIYAHPDDAKKVWVVSDGHVLVTDDGGEKWQPVTADFGAHYIAGDPTQAGRFYVSGRDGVYLTQNGRDFVPIGGPRPAGRGRINCDSAGRVLLCQWREGRTGVWRYTPANKQWQRLLDEPLAFECVADPKNPKRLLLVTNMDPFNDVAGGNGVWVSDDDGASWSQQDSGLAMRRGAAVAFNPADSSDIVVGTFGRGFFRAQWPTAFHPTATRRYTALPADQSETALAASILANGAMSEGEGKPNGWEQTWDKVTSARDAQIFKSAPASLRATADGASGMAMQQIAGHAGQTFRVSGWVKTQGDVKVNVAVQSFDSGWTKNDFNQVKYLQGDFDWQEFSKEVTIPDWAARFNMALLVDGKGSAWLDDVQMVPTNAPNATALKTETVANGEITRVVRDFGPGGFDYAYGPWDKNAPQGGQADGVGIVTIDATKHGGAGIVLNGFDLTPQTQTHLAMRARLLPGNAAKSLSVNLIGADKSVTFDLSKLNEREFVTIFAPLPEGGNYKNLQQLQVQGTNWGDGAGALKIQINSIGATSLDAKANQAAKVAQATDPTSAAPAKDKPNVPAHGFYPDFPQAWLNTHNSFVARSKENTAKPIKIIFYGDSITQGWNGEGKDVWEKNFAPLGAVNYGIGGDSTRQLLWRIQNGEVEGLNPQLVVLKIGTNNLYGDFNGGSDEEIAQGITEVVKLLRQKLPQTKILLLGILPRQNDYFTARIARINAIIAQLEDGKNVRYMDLDLKFERTPGKGDVYEELFGGDKLHLVAKGYQVLAEAILPLLKEMSH